MQTPFLNDLNMAIVQICCCFLYRWLGRKKFDENQDLGQDKQYTNSDSIREAKDEEFAIEMGKHQMARAARATHHIPNPPPLPQEPI